MFNIDSKFEKCKKKKKKKNAEKFFRFLDTCMGKYCYKLSLLRRELLLSAVNELPKSPYILHTTHWNFLNRQLPSQGSINMVKVLSLCFEQCFGRFTKLLVGESPERTPFRHLYNHVFRSP